MSTLHDPDFWIQQFAEAKSALAQGAGPSQRTAGLSLSIAVAFEIGLRYVCEKPNGEFALRERARNQVNLGQGIQYLFNALAEAGSNYREAKLLRQLLDMPAAQRVQPIINYIREVGMENIGSWVMPALTVSIYPYLNQTSKSAGSHQTRQALKYIARRANHGDFISQLPEVLTQPARMPKTARGFNP